MAETPAPAYRPDVDGLRALAVAAVILYHANVPGFAGGYVGVDVFFVISGYLITLLIMSSGHLEPRMHLKEFYLRRARRILPALFVASLAATAAACFVLLPVDLVRFARYLGATPLFVTNVVAWINGSYFETALNPVALNHYWSIAVEEQFYLVYPALLLIVRRHVPRHRLPVLIAIAAASLALSIWGSHYKPVASFYLAGTRVWELLLGAFVAFAARSAVWSSYRVASELLAIVGLVVIAGAVFLYDSTLEYPGAYALLPCVATAVLIGVGHGRKTVVGRILSWRVLVFTGLISYSLYLWHWPIFSLYRYYFISDIDAPRAVLLIAVTYLVAWLSWACIETPIRSRRVLASTRSFVWAAIAANFLLLAIALVLWTSGGLPQRFSPEVTAVATAPMHPDAVRCMTMPPDKVRAAQLCRFGPPGAQLPKVVVWGDSHALALLPAYERLAWKHEVQLYFVASASCGPLFGVADTRRHRMWQMNCSEFNEAAVEAIHKLDPRLVILGGYWSYIDTGIEPQDGADLRRGASLFRQGLERSLQRISAPGRSICAVLGVPTVRRVVPYAMAMAERRGIAPDMIGVTRTDALDEYRKVEAEIRALARGGLVETVDPKTVLCPGAACAFESHGEPLYRDTNHLSVTGAQLVAPAIEPCFTKMSEGLR